MGHNITTPMVVMMVWWYTDDRLVFYSRVYMDVYCKGATWIPSRGWVSVKEVYRYKGIILKKLIIIKCQVPM